MGVKIPVGYGQASILIQLFGKAAPFVVTCGYRKATGAVDSPNDHAQDIRTFWSAAGRPLVATGMDQAYSFLGVLVTEMTATGPVVGQSLVTVQGTGGTTAMPPNCAILMKKNTARGGRKGRGRMYFPPLSFGEENVSSLGIMPGTYTASMDSKFASLQTAWAASTVPPVLLHEDGSTPDPIVGWSCQGMIATQRRRLR